MIPVAALMLSAIFGVVAGRFAGRRGWLVVPALPALAVVLSLADVGYVDPLVAVMAIIWAMLAAVGVLVGLRLRSRAAGSGQP